MQERYAQNGSDHTRRFDIAKREYGQTGGFWCGGEQRGEPLCREFSYDSGKEPTYVKVDITVRKDGASFHIKEEGTVTNNFVGYLPDCAT